MLNYLQPGNIIEITAPLGGVVSGAPVQVGQIVGIAAKTADADDPVNIQITGVFTVNKVSAQAWAEGEEVYWDAAQEKFTTVKGGVFAGLATAVATNPSSTGSLLLCQGAYEGGFHIGSDSVPIVDDTVDARGLSAYYDFGSATGDMRGLSIHVSATGLGTYTTGIIGTLATAIRVRNPVAVQGNLELGVAASVHGMGYACGGYLGMPNAAIAPGGNIAAGVFEISLPTSYDQSPPSNNPNRVSILQLNAGGAGLASFNQYGYAISICGFTPAALAGTPIITNEAVTSGSATFLANCLGLKVGIGSAGGGNTTYYIPLVPTAEWN